MTIWVLAVTGWVLYNLYLIKANHKDFDLDQNGYSFKELIAYFRVKWIGLIFSFVLMAIVTAYDYMPQLWEYFSQRYDFEKFKWIEPFYLLTGSIAAGVQWIINKLTK
jgi:hypothetical protein